MFPLAHGISYIDLNFRNTPGVIATGVLTDPAGVVIVDPGPTSCLETLTRALGLKRYEPIAVDELAGAILHAALERGPLGEALEGKPLWAVVDAGRARSVK